MGTIAPNRNSSTASPTCQITESSPTSFLFHFLSHSTKHATKYLTAHMSQKFLLDENFCPNISDFRLAKICPRKESIVSMLGARRTAGYIAPEVFCRNFGGVSHKSDVHSYEMLVLEMIGGRKNLCVGVDNISQICFLHWIYKRLELGEELQLRGIVNEAEEQIARKMILASLRCIQTDPSNRPPMSRVVEMLQGSLDSLPIPPRTYLSSLARSAPGPIENSSTTTILRF